MSRRTTKQRRAAQRRHAVRYDNGCPLDCDACRAADDDYERWLRQPRPFPQKEARA